MYDFDGRADADVTRAVQEVATNRSGRASDGSVQVREWKGKFPMQEYFSRIEQQTAKASAVIRPSRGTSGQTYCKV